MSIRTLKVLKPLMDYPREFLQPIIGNSAGVYALDQLYPSYVIVDVIIWNHDSVNGLVYRINNQPVDLIIPASQAVVYNNIIIWKIEILSNVAYEIQLFGLDRNLIIGR